MLSAWRWSGWCWRSKDMGRRNDIDWERIERLYVAGQLSIQQIADECGVSNSQIRARAKKNGWMRDLSEIIKARTKAKVSAIDVSALVEQSAQESAGKSAQTLKRAIEEASDVAAGTIVRHRADIRLCTERAKDIEAMLDEHMSKAEGLADVVRATQAFKALVDARAKLIDKEREALGIQSGSQSDAPMTGLKVEFVEVGSR